MLVKQIMSQPVVSCSVEDTLDQAAKLMWDRDCGALPVTDPDGKAVGMITDRDICMAAHTQAKPLAEIGVRTAMSHVLYACSPQDTLKQATQLMRDRQIRRLPVLGDAGRPVGFLSLNDIALAATRQHPSARSGPEAISVAKAAQTFAAVCVHRS